MEGTKYESTPESRRARNFEQEKKDHYNKLNNIDAEQISDESNVTGYTKPSTDGVIQYDKNPSNQKVEAVVKYVNKNAGSRNLLCQPQLEEIIKQAAIETKLNVKIFSGGQVSKADFSKRGELGSKGRTGSARHDKGYGADVWLYRSNPKGAFKGPQLNVTKPNDTALLEAFATACKQGGATGIGMGRDYMGNVGMHVDIAYGNSSDAGGPVWGESKWKYVGDPAQKVLKSYTPPPPPSWLSTLMRSNIGQPNPY